MRRSLRILAVWGLLASAATISLVQAQDMEIGTSVGTPDFDTSFTDVSDYWTIVWDGDWHASAYQVAGDGEILQLQSDVWTVTLEGPIFDPKMPAGFVPGDARTALKDLISATGAIKPVQKPNGRPLRHYSSGRSWEVFTGPNNTYVYLDARVLDDKGVFLYITATMTADPQTFNDTYEQMLLLLENLQLLR